MQFIDLFMSAEWRELAQYRGIRDAQNAAHSAGFDASLGLEQVARLAQENQQMRQELVRLQTMLATVFDALAHQGVINKDAIAQELQARLAAQQAAAAQAAQYTVCASCRRQVAKNRTRLTGNGAVCDACAESSEP
jgi:hypothetical protein